MKNLNSISFIFYIFILTLFPINHTVAQEIKLPENLFYYHPAASVFGSEATWINPSALARYNSHAYQFMADLNDVNSSDSWGFVSSGEKIGVAYRKFDSSGVTYKESIYGLGFESGQNIYMGMSYRYIHEGLSFLNKRHLWSLSLTGKGKGPINWAAVFSNLNRGKIDGLKTEVSQRYSLSYRPSDENLTFSVDMFTSAKRKFSDADYIYHVEFRPKDGLYLTAQVDSDNNYHIGFRANFLNLFTGSDNSFSKSGNSKRSIVYMGRTSARQKSLIPDRKRRLLISLSGKIEENPVQPLFGKKKIPFTKILMEIYRAANDSSIAEILLATNSASLGMAQAEELREALLYFKSKNKRLIAHMSNPGNLSYFLSSVADVVVIPPASQLNLKGLEAELSFYGATLEKIGVKFEMLRLKDYKTAPETLTRKNASDKNKEQINRILDNIYGQFVTAIAYGRKISKDSTIKLIDNGPYTSKEALNSGLVDDLKYRDEMHTLFEKKYPLISLKQYLKDTLLNDNWNKYPLIAVIVADGEIRFDNSGSGFFGSSPVISPSKYKSAFKYVKKNNEIEAVLFRINSPGGYALAADKIYHFAKSSSKKKITAVSMSNVAASGGLQIAMPSSKIFASSSTITGSIGIFGGKVILSELYKKLAIGKELFSRGKNASMMTSLRAFTEDEKSKYFSHLKSFYEYFISIVAKSRNLPEDSVENIAMGKVWTGSEALEIGLVDSNGGFKAAIDYLADELGTENYRLRYLPISRPLFLLNNNLNPLSTDALLHIENRIQSGLSLIANNGEILSRMPFDIDIK